MTLLLRPDFLPAQAHMLTLVAAVALVAALREHFDIPADIKWPNDMVLHGKKISGTLTEMSAEIDFINYIVIGIGINVAHQDFPEEIADIAGSIEDEMGFCPKRAEIIEAFLEEFERCYALFEEAGDLRLLKKEYERYLVNVGRRVRVLDPKEPYEGKAIGINEKGELIVDTWESRRAVMAGEVSVRGVYGYV